MERQLFCIEDVKAEYVPGRDVGKTCSRTNNSIH